MTNQASRATKRMLDELMGSHRNLDRRNAKKFRLDWRDDEICKYHLCGWCPIREFQGTKCSMGDCHNQHNELVRVQFNKEKWRKKQDYYEFWKSVLIKVKNEYDFRIRRSNEILVDQLEAEPNSRIHSPPEPDPLNNPALQKVEAKIKSLESKAEKLKDEGNNTLADKLFLQVDLLENVKDDLIEKDRRIMAAAFAKSAAKTHEHYAVCKICGGLADQTPEKLNLHEIGVIHLGYARFHDEYTRMLDIFANNDLKSQSSSRSRSRSYGRHDNSKSYSSRSDSRSSRSSSRSRTPEDRDAMFDRMQAKMGNTVKSKSDTEMIEPKSNADITEPKSDAEMVEP